MLYNIYIFWTSDAFPSLRRRRKSETFRAQYINSEELRYGTLNLTVSYIDLGKCKSDGLSV